MSNIRRCLSVTMLAMPLLIGGAQLAVAQEVELVVIDPKAVARGYSASELMGETVINGRRESIGTIDDLVITRADDDSDAFVVLEVGDFLGLGGHLVAVPFTSLELDRRNNRIVLAGATREGGEAATTDQVLYNLTRRGIEWDLLPWCRVRRLPIMAYSPIEQGRLLAHPVLQSVAGRHGATAGQVALAWVLRQRDVIAIPRAGNPRHVRENRTALDLRLTAPDLAALDRAFPPPIGPQPLEMI